MRHVTSRSTHEQAVALALCLGLWGLGSGCGAADPAEEDDESVDSVASPIQGGYADATDAAVVGFALLNEEGAIRRTCSGTLIAPNLVLTAQHCIADTSKFVSCATSTFTAPLAAKRMRITTSASIWDETAVWYPVREVVVPSGDPQVCGRDIALLVLDEVVYEVVPLEPRLDRRIDLEETYSAVGFGIKGEAGDGGARRRRDGLHVLCVGHGCGSSNAVDGREWRGDQGVCSGDSGGPALDSRARVIGVTSRGPAGCDDPIYGGLPSFRDWMRQTGRIAAEIGEYEPPRWVQHVGEQRLEPSDDWWSCSAHGRARSNAALSALALAAAALGVRRRRR